MSSRIGPYLKKLCETHGPEKTATVFGEAMASKKIDPYAIRLPELVEAFLGRDYFTAERKLKAIQAGTVHLLEANEAVDASAFSNITGQLLVTIVKEKYKSPDFVGDQLVRVTPNPGGNLKEHKVPYLSDVLNKGEVIQQAEPYPQTKFLETWVMIPSPEKRGQICAVTMEMLFSDLTGQAQDSAASVGRALGYLREERILRMVLGLTTNYTFGLNGVQVTHATYLTTANATSAYVNRKIASTITDYTGVDAMEQMFWKMNDPATGRRIYVRPDTILVMPGKRMEIMRVLHSTEVRGGAVSNADIQTISPNPLDMTYKVAWSPIAYALLDDETALTENEIKQYVVFGDFDRAFGYREVFPLKVEQAPSMNEAEFRQDIVLQVKASEYGVPYVFDPRYVALSTAEVA